MALDLRFNLLVLLVNEVNFAIQNVDVVEERDVLLFGFDESCHDFLSGRNAGCIFDLLESVLNDLNITFISIHEVLLLLVIALPFVESASQQGCRVVEFSTAGCQTL